MEELDWEGSEDEHPAQEEAPQDEGRDDEGLVGLGGLGGGHAEVQPQQLQRAGSMTPPGSPERAGGAANGGAAAGTASAATTTAAAAAASGDVPEEWQVMDIPEEWRPRPMVRVWGLPAAAQEEELAQLLEATLAGQGASVRSVVFDPRQATAAGKVALVRFEPPPLPEEGAAEPDAGKVAEKLIAALRAAALQLHGAKINVEKTGAEVCLFLANLPADAESDEGLRAACAAHGALERCFVMRTPSGASKGYAFAEFTLPGCAAACKEAWNKAGEALRPPRDASGEAPKSQHVKLQRAEAAPVKTVSGLFGRVLYVHGMHTTFTDFTKLQRIFSEYGEVLSCYMPRSPIDPTRCRGFAFVQFKHSFAADAAFRALDGTEHEGIGKLAISFSNPEQEYAQRLGYAAFGGLPGAAGSMAGGMPAAMASMAAALPGMAGFMTPAAMAAMMGMPGMAGALGATPAGAGGTAGGGTSAPGGGAAAAAEPAAADAYGGSSPYRIGAGGSGRDAGYRSSQRGGIGYGDAATGSDPYDSGRGGSQRGGGGGGYDRDRGYDRDHDRGYGRDAYDDAGYGYGADDYGSGYGGSGRSGYGGSSRGGGGGGGRGGGYGGSNRGGRSKRDNNYQGGYGGGGYGSGSGSGYGGGYGGDSYPPKRPRY
ncbi:hypothetical protein ABPG75_013362 [Micractinium tetrahymenae]